jgi:tetratricopeptide (TPR) repeat protein
VKSIGFAAAAFIAGLAISLVIGDLIDFVKFSAARISGAYIISKAQKSAAAGNFLQAQKEYERALTKISPSNKKLLAKTKNNLALCVFLPAEQNQNRKEMFKSVLIFQEALELFKELGAAQSVKEVEINIKEAQTAIDNLTLTDG